MELERKSIFNTESTTSLSEYLSNTISSESNEDLDYLFRQEYVLYQQETSKTEELKKVELQEGGKENILSLSNVISALHRYYSYEDMIETEALLSFFEILENIKYSKYLVQYDHLLHKYLYSGYTLNNFFLKDTKKDLQTITNVNLNAPLFYGDSILPIWDDYKTGNRVSSIKEHFKNFILLQDSSKDEREYTIIRNIQRKSNQDSNRFYPKYYLPINQIPEFLFSFLFYDCRKFSTSYGINDNNRIPKRSKKEKDNSNASESAYKTVLKHIYAFHQNNFNFKTGMITDTEHGYAKFNYKSKLDRIFRYNTLETLYHYYQLYTTETFLNQIMHVFSLSYKETVQLTEYLVHCIFDDTDFIKEGLRSSLRDFLLPFDIHFQYSLLSISSSKGLNGLKEVIAESKRIAQIAWKSTFFYDLKEKVFFDINLDNAEAEQPSLNIEFLQNRIISILENNLFFKTYFDDKNNVWIHYLESQDTLHGPISYETLKEVLIPQ